MTTPEPPASGRTQKRLAEEDSENPETDERKHSKRQRSQSLPRSVAGTPQPSVENVDFRVPPQQCPPPSGTELDRLHYHVDLQEFAKTLQGAVNAAFSSDRRSRYSQVSALLLSWEDEDPQLPVSIEIKALKDVFIDLYGFEVEEWQIPATESHMELNLRVLNFLKDSNTKHLKIVYYAGHGKLSNHGQSLWTR